MIRFHRLPTLLFISATAALAQEPAAERGQGLRTLAPFTIEVFAEEDAILPLDRAPESVLGMPLDLLETPRAATVLPEPLIEAVGAGGIEDLTALAPGASANAQFGHVTTPLIRGDIAESYLNGQRRSSNLYGYKPVLHAVERVDVVRGPASVAFGPGYHSGGYVNYASKRPGLRRDFGSVEARLGSWAEGDSWRNASLELDVSQVLLPGELGLRLSLSARENETFIDSPAAEDDHRAAYVALRWEPTERYRLDLAASYLHQKAPQLLGVNRPTPQLIEDNRYFTGSAGFVDGAFVLTPTGTIEAPRGLSLLSDDDYSEAEVAWVQLIQTLELADGLSWTNRTLAESVDRERVHEFAYAEFVDQQTFAHRSELLWTAPERLDLLIGVALRYEGRESYVNFFNEIPFAYDLTEGANFSIADRYPGLLVPGTTGPGGQQFFSGVFSPETTDSALWNAAAFAQATWDFAPDWRLIAGLRGDLYDAEARDPFQPVRRDSGSFSNHSAEASLIRFFGSQSAYLTYSQTRAVEGSIAGGGIMLDASGALMEDNFDNRNTLIEAGWRGRFFENALAAGVTGFYQERNKREIRGGRSDLRLHGAEAELLYQPNRRFYAFANAAWLEARYDDSAPGQLGGRSIYGLYAPGTGSDGLGDGAGFDFLFFDQVPPGDYRVPGVSRWTLAGGLGWRPERGLGGSLWGDWQSAQPGNLDDEYEIPSRLLLNAALTWRFERALLRLRVLNLTDNDGWIHNGQTFFANQLISRQPPRRAELSARFDW